ncbi:MAG: hypothetical protein ACXVCA_19215, partial [Bdellovibrio sp.]
HTPFQKETAREILTDMRGTMLNMSNPSESSFAVKLTSHQMPPQSIRESLGLKDKDLEKILPQVGVFIKSLKP